MTTKEAKAKALELFIADKAGAAVTTDEFLDVLTEAVAQRLNTPRHPRKAGRTPPVAS